jgi:hypothetical protein
VIFISRLPADREKKSRGLEIIVTRQRQATERDLNEVSIEFVKKIK